MACIWQEESALRLHRIRWRGMDGVEAVACDINSDYLEVFNYFYLRKNFNDKVVAEVRKDEQRRLYSEGRIEEAKLLKNIKYILTSNRQTLREKDDKAK